MNLREMDIRREARQAALAEGMQLGLSRGKIQGAEEKSVEAAVIAVKKYNAKPEDAARDFNASVEKVRERLGLIQ